jgi:hypothetical protein
MAESKIELTDRWRREGNWPAAMKFKERAIKDFRAEGLKGPEAKEAAWEATARAFPPLPAAEDLPADPPVSPEDMDDSFLDAAQWAVEKWQASYSVALTDDTFTDLVATAAYCCWMGLHRYIPASVKRWKQRGES